MRHLVREETRSWSVSVSPTAENANAKDPGTPNRPSLPEVLADEHVVARPLVLEEPGELGVQPRDVLADLVQIERGVVVGVDAEVP